MKKKALLLVSMGALVCTVGITALAVGGANQLDIFPVKADPTGYSVTFDTSSKSTTVEAVGNHYAICTTTAAGNKVSVMGSDSSKDCFAFKGVSFKRFFLWTRSSILEEVGANDFDHITGFAISFSDEEGEPVPMDLIYGEETPFHVTSGTPYTGLSITPDDSPEFIGDGVIVTSLTIWYSC